MSNTNTYLPVANYTKPYWLSLEDEEPFSRYQTSAKVPESSDVLIIGSGYAGTSTAFNLLKNDPSLDVTLVEARTLCSGATGRNGGHLKPYCHRMYKTYEDAHGPRIAAQVVNSEVEHLYTIKKLIEDEQIDCDFVLTRACDVYTEKIRIENDMESMRHMMANPYVKDEVKKSIQVVKGADVSTLSKVPNAQICVTYPAAHVWPWKLMIALLKKSVDKGLKLYANTPVTKVTRTPQGKYLVETANGFTIANKVVYCTNGYTKSVLKEFRDTIIPVKGAITHIKPDSTPVPQLPNTYGIFAELGLTSDYLINRGDGGVVVGGGSYTMIDSKGDHSELFDITDDSYLTDRARDYFEGYMQKTYSTWKNFKSSNDYTWSGILGFTNDMFPYVGELDFIGKKNAYICAGFSGHGMPRVYLSGKSIADSITSGKSVAELAAIPECYFASLKRLTSTNEHAYLSEIKHYIKSKL